MEPPLGHFWNSVLPIHAHLLEFCSPNTCTSYNAPPCHSSTATNAMKTLLEGTCQNRFH
uniref:Uncharacterized protein n=1 Tax=Anguilla anguilla TaxID=7936 RepID=A0A0E9PUG0_ANGAN